MIKIENGMYVRHKCGNGGQTISRCTNKVNIAYNVFYIHTDVKGEVIYKSNILKASHNIIDLIEVGDYVNGFRVDEVEHSKSTIFIGNTEKVIEQALWSNDIKSIVTKEAFQNAEYRVVRENE